MIDTQSDLFDALLDFKLTDISSETRFWMVRTKKGYFYEEFLRERYVAVAWNTVDKTTSFSTASKDAVCESICALYTDIKRPTTVFNKCDRFINQINLNDILVIPSAGSRYVTLVDQLSAGYVKTQFLKNHPKPSTVNEHITRFKALIRWGYENDYIADINYLNKIKAIPDKEKKEKLAGKYLEREELNDLLKAMQVPNWNNLTALMALSGLRVGEALALTMNDIDFKEKVIHVTKTYDVVNKIVTPPKTTNSQRDVYMQPELEKLLRDIRRDTNKRKMLYGFRSNLFLCDQNGDYLQYYAFNKYLKETSEKTFGRPVTTHALRHTQVSLLAEAGVPLETITRRVGHGDSKITKEIYLHITKKMKEHDNEIVSKVSLL